MIEAATTLCILAGWTEQARRHGWVARAGVGGAWRASVGWGWGEPEPEPEPSTQPEPEPELDPSLQANPPQVEGAARKANPAALWGEGEAWAYRRDGYAAMAALLGERGVTVAPRMYAPAPPRMRRARRGPRR